jgi:hypothetical protein
MRRVPAKAQPEERIFHMKRSISRRHFLAAGATGAAVLARHSLLAAEEGIVPTMTNATARSKITVQPIRRNISVLEGSGGNIAVLTGPDGKLLVDSGFSVSRPAISHALASINRDPIKQLINTHWHYGSHQRK